MRVNFLCMQPLGYKPQVTDTAHFCGELQTELRENDYTVSHRCLSWLDCANSHVVQPLCVLQCGQSGLLYCTLSQCSTYCTEEG